jgi:hypothetical protein
MAVLTLLCVWIIGSRKEGNETEESITSVNSASSKCVLYDFTYLTGLDVCLMLI